MVQHTDSDERPPFPSRLRAAMRNAGYPDRGGAVRLGRELGISERAVGKWMNGEAMPDTKRLDAISRLLGVTAEWLLTGRDAGATTHRQNMIPVVGIVQGGADGYWEEMGYPPGHGDRSLTTSD